MYTGQLPVQYCQLLQNKTEDNICSNLVLENMTRHSAQCICWKNPPEPKEFSISIWKGKVWDTGTPLDSIQIRKQGNAQGDSL
jgi:hypothetical protein